MSANQRIKDLSDDTSNAILDLNNDVAKVLSSVMGPQYADATQQAMTKKIAEQIKAAVSGTMTETKAKKMGELINKLLIKPVTQKIQMDNKEEVKNIKEKVKESTRAVSDIAKIAEEINKDNAGEKVSRRQKAVDRMMEINSNIQDHMKNKKLCEKQIQEKNRKLTQLTINYDNLTDEQKKELEDTRKRLEDLKTAMNTIDLEFINVHDNTVGGQNTIARMAKQPLKLPGDLSDTTATNISNSIKIYMRHRVHEYYMIMHVIEAISESYDSDNGTYYEPPSKLQEYKNGQPMNLSMEQIKVWEQQSKTLYCEILSQIKETGMAEITQEFKCGMNKQKSAKCGVDDGVTAIYCLFAKYGKDGAHSRNDLEKALIEAPMHFKWGSPRTKIEYLKPKLSKIIELQIQLKHSLTLEPIVDVLTETHPRFITICDKYREVPRPEDCAVSIEQFFAEIEEVCKSIERSQGEGVWRQVQQAHNTTIIEANNITKEASVWDRIGDSKGKGKGKGKSKGKVKGKGKSKGKGSKGKYQDNKTCAAKKCNEISGKYRLCTVHHKEAMEGKTITAKDGEQITYEGRPKAKTEGDNDKNKKTYGFSREQLRGLLAMGRYIEETIKGEENDDIQPFQQPDNKRKRAFESTKTKATKQQKFIQAINNSQ